MLLSSDDDVDRDAPTATRMSAAVAVPAAPPQLALPPVAFPFLVRLREALACYRAYGTPADLQAGFNAAAAVIATVVQPQAGGRADLEEMRRLARTVPEFGDLLSCAAAEAERAVCAGSGGVWSALGLRSAAPAWSPAEREAARMVFACACAPSAQADGARMQDGLRAVAAARFAELLCRELTGSEEAWTRALGRRYDSVRHRCAPRTTWRSRGLSELVRTDDVTRRALAIRLERWLAAGGSLATLADELEAALVHARTPARFA
jgi:hypothetical protein